MTHEQAQFKILGIVASSGGREFFVVVQWGDITLGRGRGSSLVQAEQRAVRDAFGINRYYKVPPSRGQIRKSLQAVGC